jgi:hypothetical protein
MYQIVKACQTFECRRNKASLCYSSPDIFLFYKKIGVCMKETLRNLKEGQRERERERERDGYEFEG